MDKYSSGFKPDISKLFHSTLPIETGEQSHEINPEFVGSEKRFRIQVYYELRKQLAEHIREQYNKDYEEFGGTEGVFNWYIQSLKYNMEHIITVLCDYAIKHGENPKYTPTYINSNGDTRPLSIRLSEYDYPQSLKHLINTTEKSPSDRFLRLDDKNGKKANYYFRIDPVDGQEIAFWTGLKYDSLPIFFQKHENRHPYNGNHLLNIVDPVSDIISPVDLYGGWGDSTGFSCIFEVGFSKSGFNARKKQFLDRTQNKKG